MLKKERILDLKKYFVFLLILLLVFISYSIIKPFMIALISAFILAFFLRPFYKTLNKKLSSSLSAIISILAMILIIAIPGTLILNRLRLNIQQQITSENIAKISELSIPLVEKFAGNAEKIIEILASLSISLINSTINYVPSLILNLIIILVGIYYILPNWEKIVNYLEKIFPIQNQKEISREISKTTKGIIYGLLLLAVLQFLVSLIGFYILGIPMYLVLSFIIFFLTFIPGGPALVWVPLAIYYIFQRNLFIVIGVLILGIILSYILDTAVRIKILGNKSQINPLIMLIGVLGGIYIFGLFGFIIGPLILSYSLKIIEELIED